MREAEKENAELVAMITDHLANAIRANDRDLIRQAGEDLNGLGGTVLMKMVLDKVAEPYDDPEYGRVCSMVDHAWDRIGDWLA